MKFKWQNWKVIYEVDLKKKTKLIIASAWPGLGPSRNNLAISFYVYIQYKHSIWSSYGEMELIYTVTAEYKSHGMHISSDKFQH